MFVCIMYIHVMPCVLYVSRISILYLICNPLEIKILLLLLLLLKDLNNSVNLNIDSLR